MTSFRNVLHRLWTYSVIILCLVLFFSISINLYVRAGSESRIVSIEEAPEADAAIVLGASVFRDGRLTPVLADRVQTAVLLYRESTIANVLVTGDGESQFYNEVIPMHDFLVAEDVPDEAIMIDPHGIDTYQSLRRAKEEFGISRAAIVSQEFHLYRALFIAKKLGIEAYGVPAIGTAFSSKDLIREFFATVKSFGMVMWTR